MMTVQGIAARHVQRLVADDDGATMMEYALIVSLASIAIGALIPELRSSIDELFLRTAAGLSAAAAGG